MAKEYGPTTTPINKDNPQSIMALVDGKATVIVVCHQCGVLYSAAKINFVTTAVAERTAWDHGNFFSSVHHVSVLLTGEPPSFEETLAVNEGPKLKPTPSLKRNFFIPVK